MPTNTHFKILGELVSLVLVMLIAAMPEPQRTTAQIEWEFSTEYQREHPLVKQLGTALRMTSADMDLAWQQAAGL